MPILENASNVVITNSTFIDIEGANRTGPCELLAQHVAWKALHNSSERYDPPRCHPETRKSVLSRLRQWTAGHGEPVLWLSGAAGSGKSAIAQTLAEELHLRGILGASFFFKRDINDINTSAAFVPTIAQQLATSFPALRPHIFNAISNDPHIFKKSLNDQFIQLITNPLNAAQETVPPVIVIVDGLDECSSCLITDEEHPDLHQRLILKEMENICCTSLPIRFLISSRPEAQIRTAFQATSLKEISLHVPLNHEAEADSDIELFLRDSFTELRRQKPSLDPAWPSNTVIKTLIMFSSGHFIYPSTVIRHLFSPRVNPENGIKEILGITAKSKHGEKPLAPVDALYRHVLDSVAPQSRAMVFDILQLLLDIGGGLRYSQHLMSQAMPNLHPNLHSIECIAKVLATTPAQIRADLADLHSIMDVPSTPGSADIRLIHASFYDFLIHRKRSGQFFLGGSLSLRLQTRLLRYIHHNCWHVGIDGFIWFIIHIVFYQTLLIHRIFKRRSKETSMSINIALMFYQAAQAIRARYTSNRPSFLPSFRAILETVLMSNLSEFAVTPAKSTLYLLKRNALIVWLNIIFLLKLLRRPIQALVYVDLYGMVMMAHVMLCLPMPAMIVMLPLGFTWFRHGTNFEAQLYEVIALFIAIWPMISLFIVISMRVCRVILYLRRRLCRSSA